MSTTITRFIHLRCSPNDICSGATTIAYTVTDISPNKPRQVAYAVARCHEGDQFIKKIGRDKATGRLKARDFAAFGDAFSVPGDMRLDGVQKAIIQHAKKKFPQDMALQQSDWE